MRDSQAVFFCCQPAHRSHRKQPICAASIVAAAGWKTECACVPACQGLKIALQLGNERVASSRLGTYYARLPNGSRSLFAGSESAKRAELVSLQVWRCAE